MKKRGKDRKMRHLQGEYINRNNDEERETLDHQNKGKLKQENKRKVRECNMGKEGGDRKLRKTEGKVYVKRGKKRNMETEKWRLGKIGVW